jgi:HK97 family phage portal protein
MWSWIKGLLGNYKGQQQTKPLAPIFPTATTSSVNNALQIPAIWECAQKIIKAMACLPCDLLREVDADGNTELIRSGQLYELLNRRPNASMTPADFFKTITLDYLLHGNAYIRLDKAIGADYIAALTPLNPGQVTVNISATGATYYEYYSQDEKIIKYTPPEIMHWKGIGNGIVGLDTLAFARTTLDEAIKAQETSADVFKNKGRINGILYSENPLMNREQIRKFLENFSEMQNAQLGIPFLPQGVKFQNIGLSPAETQLLQTREYIVKEFARWFGIPYGLLTGEATELVDLSNYFYETTILPMCVELEQVLQQKLINDPRIRVKFRTSVLKRMSDQTRIQMQTSYAQNGLRTRNELRREDGYSRMDGADDLTAQNNLYPVDKLGQTDRTQTPQTPIAERPVKQ